MDSQDQRKSHTQGHESHGVHVCHKCGWPFPNPHPSAKHRRAHKKICGTIEDYKLCAFEGQPRSNGSDDEHVSDDDHKTPGPKALDTGNNEKGNNGIEEKINRSEDEVFSDAVAEFSDSGQSQGVKERSQEGSLDSGTSAESADKKDPKFLGSSDDNDFNDQSHLTVESRDECQIQHPTVLQGERVEVANTLDLQGQLSGSTMDPLSYSIADLKAEESTVVHTDDVFVLSTESHSSTSEAMPDVLPENKICTSENVTDCSLTSSAMVIDLKGKDEIKSEIDETEIVILYDTVVGETCEGDSKIEVSDAVCLGHQVAVGAESSLISSAVETNLKGKDGIKSDLDEVEIEVPSDTAVGATCEEESKIAVSNSVYSDLRVAEGAANLREKDIAKFLSVLAQDDPPHGSNSVVITNASTNDVQVDSAEVVQFANSSDVKIFQEKEEGNVNANTLPTSDDRTDVPHPPSEYEDFKDHEGVVSQNVSSLHSSKSLKHEEDDVKETVTEENNFHFNPSQLSEKSDVLLSDMNVMDSSSSINKELINSEPMAEKVHAKEHIEVSPVKLAVESSQRSDEIGMSIDAIKSEMNESHMVHLSEEQGTVDVENSQQTSLPESTSMASSDENLSDASFGSVTRETSIISIDNTSHHEKGITEINDVTLDGKDVGANLENDIGTQTNDVQLIDLLQPEVKQSSDAADEIDKIENFDITGDQCRETANNQIESALISEAVIDEPEGKSTGMECENIGPLSGAQEDVKEGEINDSAWEEVKEDEIDGNAQEEVKEDEINGNVNVHEECNRSLGTSNDSRQAWDAEVLMKAAEDLAGNYASLSSSNAEPSVQYDFAVKEDQDGHPGSEVSGITAVTVQDQGGDNLVKHSSSGIDASVDYSSRCDSLEANWGSVSVLSMQSDAPAVIDAETSPSTGLVASREAGKSNLNNTKAASEKQQSEKSEMSEAPSFMKLVEPRDVGSHEVPSSEGQKGKNPQQLSSISHTGWFPSLTQVTSESPRRNKNEEIIAKVTNWSTSKEHTPLKSLLGEAAHSDKPTSPKWEESSVNKKNGKVSDSNSSGLTTVNSILGPESPAAHALIGDAAKEWNSPARYPAEMKREKRKAKSRPYWIQLVCCSSVDFQRR